MLILALYFQCAEWKLLWRGDEREMRVDKRSETVTKAQTCKYLVKKEDHK